MDETLMTVKFGTVLRRYFWKLSRKRKTRWHYTSDNTEKTNSCVPVLTKNLKKKFVRSIFSQPVNYCLHCLTVSMLKSHEHNCTSLLFSERELKFMFARGLCHRRSVCRLWRSCALLRWLKFSAMFLRHRVPWPSVDIQVKFYEDRPRGTPPSGELNRRGVAKYSDFGPIDGYISETVQDRR